MRSQFGDVFKKVEARIETKRFLAILPVPQKRIDHLGIASALEELGAQEPAMSVGHGALEVDIEQRCQRLGPHALKFVPCTQKKAGFKQDFRFPLERLGLEFEEVLVVKRHLFLKHRGDPDEAGFVVELVILIRECREVPCKADRTHREVGRSNGAASRGVREHLNSKERQPVVVPGKAGAVAVIRGIINVLAEPREHRSNRPRGGAHACAHSARDLARTPGHRG